MVYKVTIKKSAVKTLKKIQDPYYSSIKTAIFQLGENPRPFGYIKLKGREAYRIRVSDYRIIYEIFDSELIVDVVAVGPRKDIYLK